MPRSAEKTRGGSKKTRAVAPPSGPPAVMTCEEAAAYLRVSEEELLRSAVEQGLPGRTIGTEWRFLKSALDDWLRAVPRPSSREALLRLAGAFKDDPDLDAIVREAYERRGRPMIEKAG